MNDESLASEGEPTNETGPQRAAPVAGGGREGGPQWRPEERTSPVSFARALFSSTRRDAVAAAR